MTIKVKQPKPKIGSRYATGNKEFVITGLPDMNNDKWVEYTDKDSKRDYYCRLEAFLERFQPIPD